MAGVFFVPILISAMMVGIYFAHKHIGTSYLPLLVSMMIFLGLLETILPFRKISLKKQNILTDLIFIFVNPIALPVLWYFIFKQLFNMQLNPYSIFDSMPLLIQVPLFFVMTEFFRYWVHRFQHEIPFLWKFHAVHHCMPELYYLNQFVSHPCDYFLRSVLPLTPLVIFKFDPLAAAFAQGLLTLFSMLSHGNATIKNGFWNYIFPTYEVHRWHHSFLPEEANANYGVAFSGWDHLFRTFKFPSSGSPEKFGIEDESYEIADWKGLMKKPFQKLFKL